MSASKAGIAKLIQPSILRAAEYIPVVPLDILAAEIGIPEDQLVKLDANENPYGPAPGVLRALEDFRAYHIYPDPTHAALRSDLATYTGTSADRIVVGSGADELIDLLYRLFVGPGDRVIDSVPTFGMYEFSAGVAGADYVGVPRLPNYQVDVDGIRAALNERTRIIWLTSPNNPTGNLLEESELRSILELGIPVVVDEAYAEFSGTSLLPCAERYENLIVLRTFSKWAGIAGLRVGYGVFPADVVPQLMKIKPPYNVNSVGLVAARAALGDPDWRVSVIGKIVAERSRLFEQLSAVSFLDPVPSAANFVFCRIRGRDAREIRDFLRAQGILIRYYNSPLLRNAIRVSVGLASQTDRLISALRTL